MLEIILSESIHFNIFFHLFQLDTTPNLKFLCAFWEGGKKGRQHHYIAHPSRGRPYTVDLIITSCAGGRHARPPAN